MNTAGPILSTQPRAGSGAERKAQFGRAYRYLHKIVTKCTGSLMYSAWEIQRVCGGTSLPWSGGGWRRRDCCAKGSASLRWRGGWRYTASRSAVGRESWSSLGSMDCVKRQVPAVGQSWTAANWPSSNWRSSWDPRRSDTPADYGAHGVYRISSSTKPGCDTMRTTSGASCASLTGLASGPLDGQWSVTKRASATGRNTVGRRLKKSPARRAHDHLHRRKRIERTATRVYSSYMRGQPMQSSGSSLMPSTNALRRSLTISSRRDHSPTGNDWCGGRRWKARSHFDVLLMTLHPVFICPVKP